MKKNKNYQKSDLTERLENLDQGINFARKILERAAKIQDILIKIVPLFKFKKTEL